jgi:molecular chaperone DnaK (HSP70)
VLVWSENPSTSAQRRREEGRVRGSGSERAIGSCTAWASAQSSVVPAREHRVFATKQDDQLRIEFDVWEGESADPAHNRHLGRYAVLDLPRRPPAMC